MNYRVDQLAAAADVTVDTVRFYQAKGLLPPPRREGRVAWYGDEHIERLGRIRQLQAKGLTLAAIRRVLEGELDAADEALVAALSASPAEQPISMEELADRSGIPLGLLRAVEREGLLIPRADGYTSADVDVARAGLVLLEHGLPLSDLLDLARQHHAAMRAVAERAVELFDDYVRHPLRLEGRSEDEAAARLVDAFERLLPATASLIAHHFTRTLLAVAQEHIERVGDEAERAAVRDASR